jgi:AAA family ATP:ADP antiporter
MRDSTSSSHSPWQAALTIGVAALFLLFGYELVRSVAQSLYISAYGAAKLPLVMALGPVGTLLWLYGYGLLLSWWGARKAILSTCLLSALALLGCWWAIRHGSRVATGVLYVVREAYIVLLVEQVWSFINSTLRRGEGRSWNGPICGIASLGAITGGWFVHHWAVRMGSQDLLILAAVTLVPTALFTLWAYRWGGEPQPAPGEIGGRQGHLGVHLLRQQPILFYLALLVGITQVVSTLVDLQLSYYVERSFPLKDQRTSWLGGFYALLNVGAAVMQFVITPLLLRRMKVRTVHLGIPVLHGMAVVLVLVLPGLWTAALAYGLFKALDYSLFRAAKELVYVPLTYDARYRAKELIDAFGYRAAKGGVGGILALVGRLGYGVGPSVLPLLILAGLAGWVPLAWRLTDDPESTRPHSP